ncbi:MAG: hypothetical protein WD749_13695, partial [Phycisphaerales bacterium]
MIDPVPTSPAPSPAPAATADPALASDPTLLRTYLALNLDLDNLANHTTLPLDTLLAWAETPAIAAAAAAWLRHRKLALESALAEARLLILPALTRLATSAESPLERRRAATLIMRTDRPPRANGGLSGEAAPASAPRTSSPPPPPPTPP